jgi:hypothetical protein
LRLSPARVPAGPGVRSGSPEPYRSASSKQLYLHRNAAVLTPEVPSSIGLAGRLTPHHGALSPTTAGAEEQDNGQPSASAQRVPARPRRTRSTRSDGVPRTRGGNPWSARDRAGRRRNRRTVLSQRKACVAIGLAPVMVGLWTLGGADRDRSAVAGLEGPGWRLHFAHLYAGQVPLRRRCLPRTLREL